jgi:hypothetical protein
MKEMLLNSKVSSTYSFMIDDIGHWLFIYLKARVDILRVLQSPHIEREHLVPRTITELSHMHFPELECLLIVVFSS